MSAFATVALIVFGLAVARYVIGAAILAAFVIGGAALGIDHGAAGLIGGAALGAFACGLLVKWCGHEADRGEEVYLLIDGD